MKPGMNTGLIMNYSSLFISGAMNWKPGWLQFEEPSAKGNISQLLEKANQMVQSADTKEKILELVNAYEQVLKIDPKNQEALYGAGLYNALIGFGYCDQKEEKAIYFSSAIRRFEQRMYLHSRFADLVDNHEKVWEACRVLSNNELNSLFFYYLALGSLFKESLNAFGKICNLHWGSRFKKILKNMMEIDPTWGGGTPYYAWAVYYATAPRIAGFDLKKSEDYFAKAIEIGPEMLNFRRTRAFLLHTKNKNREAFKKDIEWVLVQSPHKVRHYLTYPWHIFIQRDVQQMLDHIDDYF